MTTTEILTGIKDWVLSKLSLKQDVINDLAAIRSGSQAGSTAVQPSDLSSYFNNASYDTNTHRINFYHGQNIVAYVDASPFIVDGMVNDVRIESGYLVIDFNTDSGKQDISIPLTDIFDPSNYYNKTQTDGLLAQKQDVVQDLATIRSGASAGATAVQPAALNSALSNTVAESGVFDLSVHNAVNGVPATYASLSAAITALNALSAAYKNGGMSFKFIQGTAQSSDNKYVQFRYMGTDITGTPNPFLDTANWQGVDDEPIPGSDNLVKSGGTEKRINTINIFGDYEGEVSYNSNAGYIGASGGKVTGGTAFIFTDPIQLTKGDKIFFTAKASEGVSIISSCDANGDNIVVKVIGQGSYSTRTKQKVLYEVLETGYYIFSGGNPSNNEPFIIEKFTGYSPFADFVTAIEGPGLGSKADIVRKKIHAAYDNHVVKIVSQTLTSAQKAQALANLGITGIDDDLVKNSTNLVTSGGVEKYVGSEVTEDLTISADIKDEFISYRGIAVTFSGGAITNPIQVKAGDKITYNGRGYSDVCGIALTDSTGSFYTPVVNYSGSSSSDQTLEYTVEQDGYIALCNIAGNTYRGMGTGTKEYVTGLLALVPIVESLVSNYSQLSTNVSNLSGTVTAQGTKIDNIEKDITTIETPVQVTVNSGNFIKPSGVLSGAISSGKYSSPYLFNKGDKVKYIAKSSNDCAAISISDETGTEYTPVKIGVGNSSQTWQVQTFEYIVQNDNTYLVFSTLDSTSIGTITVEHNCINNEIEDLYDKIGDESNLLTIFDNIVCIGDSLTYSAVYTASSTIRQARVTYPQSLAKLCGATSFNYATSGASTLACWNTWGSQIEAKDNALAIIYLGTNGGVSDTLDTDVVGDDPDNWANNNVGAYCRFINKLQGFGYKVILIKPWVTSGTGDSDLSHTQDVLNKIALRFNCVVFEPITNGLPEYHVSNNYYDTVHMNEFGYSWFANTIIKKINELWYRQKMLLV